MQSSNNRHFLNANHLSTFYDGFVFSFETADPGFPPIASGGRYDALTRVLGGGRVLPAVGGIVRPEALLALGGAAP